MARTSKCNPARFFFLALLALALMGQSGCAFLKALSQEEPGQPRSVNAPKYWDKAMAYREAKDYKAAARDLELAISADPDMYHAYFMLGVTYKDMGQTDKARAAWQRGIKKAESGPERKDYPRERALAQMHAGMASLAPAPPPPPPAPMAKKPAAMPRPMAKSKMARGKWAVLYSSSLDARFAMRDKARVNTMGYSAMLQRKAIRGRTWHRVWAGCCTSKGQAEMLRRQMRKRGIKKELTVMMP